MILRYIDRIDLIESVGVFYVQCETPYQVVEEKISKLELKCLLVNLDLRTGRKF
jgi:hypothetical protein